MRHLMQRILIMSSLVLLVAGCATVQVSREADDTAREEAPAQVAQREAHWQFDGGARPPAERDGYRPPVKLAVLLPLTGPLAGASAPVRDGLLAGYYSEQRRRPDIQFYDTAGTAGGAIAAYQRALGDGADQILGPLGRDEVDAVFQNAKPGVSVLALNRGNAAAPANDATFSLAPEDEGINAADYLLARKALRILVLSSGDDYARRSAAAFAKRLTEGGGAVVQTIAVVGDKPGDIAPVLQAAAQRDGGMDAVFLAVRGAQARAVAPQITAAGLAGKPLVATSQLLSGTGKAEQDRALDGIVFPAERWSVAPINGLPSMASASDRLPTARGGAAKLFAFGYDAWLLTGYLEYLASGADANVQGATGVLRVGPTGNILRAPGWSTFSGGYVVPMSGTPASGTAAGAGGG